MNKYMVKQIVKPALYLLAIMIVLWEQLIFKPIRFVSQYMEKNKIIHKVSEKIRHSNPYVALLILASCGIPLIPFKMAGLYLVGHGYAILGIGTFGLAKIVGGAISLHLFNLTEPAIRKIVWVNFFLNWAFNKKNKIKNILIQSKAYIVIKETIHSLKMTVKNFMVKQTFIQYAKNIFKKKEKFPAQDNRLLIESSPEYQNLTFSKQVTSKVNIMNYTVSSALNIHNEKI